MKKKNFDFASGIVDNENFNIIKMKNQVEYYHDIDPRTKSFITKERSIESSNFILAEYLTDKLTDLINFYAYSLNDELPQYIEEINYENTRKPITISHIINKNDIVFPPEEIIVKNYHNLDKIRRLGELKKLMYGAPKSYETDQTDKYFKTIVNDFIRPQNNKLNKNFSNLEVLYNYGIKLIEKDKKARKTNKAIYELTDDEKIKIACIQTLFNGAASFFNVVKLDMFKKENVDNINKYDDKVTTHIKLEEDTNPIINKIQSTDQYKFSDTGRDIFKYTDNINLLLMNYKDDENEQTSFLKHNEVFEFCCNIPSQNPEFNRNENIFDEIIFDAINKGTYKQSLIEEKKEIQESSNDLREIKRSAKEALDQLNMSIFGLSSLIGTLFNKEDIEYINKIKNEIKDQHKKL